ncbi:CHRD domain-containing protein [Alicyclobacillus dauci]|uniref:CHRD domain-containing protein n=1 Tax=Alicyclobacillus dauci TaxID=1475485 RepID=A0ABY6Z9C9_9BACL|nr:CHRD domain-containing protein [Alicyclobacillus dauci]WAH39503.1 CHRD domain-containing protein [Alicyclobacillus dauci]WAH39563.1 CHRD domain-containing protein [Alicyclobacillus dauci]
MTSKTLATVASVITVATFGLAGCGTSNSTSNTVGNITTNGSSVTQNSTSTSTSNAAKTGTKSVAKTAATSAIATLDSTKGNKVKGTATLSLNPKTHQLTVIVTASGLAPNSVHPEHIHSGTTTKTGPIVYALGDLTANKSGDATATTVIKGVKSIPTSGWVINIHQSTKDLTVVASGDVTTK